MFDPVERDERIYNAGEIDEDELDPEMESFLNTPEGQDWIAVEQEKEVNRNDLREAA